MNHEVAPAPNRSIWRALAMADTAASSAAMSSCVRRPATDAALAPGVGDRVALGISHPCTTFDKWHWMPMVDDDYRVVDAVVMHF